MTPAQDGFGQSLWDDIRWGFRFRRIRREAIPWRSPSGEEDRTLCAHPTLGRFGDEVAALAEWDGRRWIVLENLWHGWPDPPRYALFALDRDEAVWMAWGFDAWPLAWRKPWRDEADQAARRERAERLEAASRLALRHVLLLLCGAPLAFVCWWLGAQVAAGGWVAIGRASLPVAQATLALAGVFGLAALTRIAGRRLRAGGRRMTAQWRRRARRRWAGGRPRREFARVYRSAVRGGALGTAVLLSALLAGLGLGLLDQSLVLIVAFVLLVGSQLVLRLFSLLGFRTGRCLAACVVLAGFAGWMGLI